MLDLKQHGTSIARDIAFYSAANAAAIVGEAHSLFWITLGQPDDLDRLIASDVLAQFVASNPAAPVEALYRYAAAQGFHKGEPDGWETLPFAWRSAYAAFSWTLPVYLKLVADEVAAQARAAVVPDGPVLAAALIDTDVRDTVLRTAADERVTNPNMAVVLLSPEGSVTDADGKQGFTDGSGVPAGGASSGEPDGGLPDGGGLAGAGAPVQAGEVVTSADADAGGAEIPEAPSPQQEGSVTDANNAEPTGPVSGVDTSSAADPHSAVADASLPGDGVQVTETEVVGDDLGDLAQRGHEPAETLSAPEADPPAEDAAPADVIEEAPADAPVKTSRKRRR